MKITQENFVLKLAQKNERALEYVIDNYGGLVKAIVKKHLHNLAGYQEECIDDVFLAVWNNSHSFDPAKNTFANWIAAIAKYKTIDYRRKFIKQLQHENLDAQEIAVEGGFHSELFQHELDKDLDDFLSCLNTQDKELFLKLYVQEQDVGLISKETGLKRAVIYNRISRGKQKLKKSAHLLERRI
ncbi:MAG: sigma-70 family RNA polymerase sigma factor [Firmicutes bacterium]|nr:sigma-70 family RNA polymerase sigma factor [Bacillota bacterium]